jgi:hypothetical protein
MKFLIFNLSVVSALAYLILGQEHLADIGKTVTEKGEVSLEQAIAFIKSPTSKELTKKITKIDKVTQPGTQTKPVAAEQIVLPKFETKVSKKIITAKNNKPETLQELPPLPKPELIKSFPETKAPKPIISAALSSPKATSQTFWKDQEPKQPPLMSRGERRKELLKIARSAEKLFIRRLTQ